MLFAYVKTKAQIRCDGTAQLIRAFVFAVLKTKALILSYVVMAQLICAFVFTSSKRRFSHDAGHICTIMS